MNPKIPTHLQSIINIINTYEFVYADNRVTATIDAYVEVDELKTLLQDYRARIADDKIHITDEERQQYVDAVGELQLAISELEK